MADSGHRRVAVFDTAGKFLFAFGGAGSTKPLIYPYGIGIIAEGRVLVADTGAAALYEFDSAGRYLRTWLESKAQVGPACVAVGGESIYVSDMRGGQILKFDSQGSLRQKLRPAQVSLKAPQGLALDQAGTIWVADSGNYNVKQLKPKGELAGLFDGGPSQAFTTVKGLALDSQQRIYVTDTLANCVRVFDKQGRNLQAFGGEAQAANSFKLPVGLSIDQQDRIYVADQANNRIQVWARE